MDWSDEKLISGAECGSADRNMEKCTGWSIPSRDCRPEQLGQGTVACVAIQLIMAGDITTWNGAWQGLRLRVK